MLTHARVAEAFKPPTVAFAESVMVPAKLLN